MSSLLLFYLLLCLTLLVLLPSDKRDLMFAALTAYHCCFLLRLFLIVGFRFICLHSVQEKRTDFDA